jgi:predicted transcriptional regulator
MRIDQTTTRPVQCCRLQDSLAQAAQLMWDHDCGSLPVCGNDVLRVVAVIIDRDICMHALFQGRPLDLGRASKAPSPSMEHNFGLEFNALPRSRNLIFSAGQIEYLTNNWSG